MTTTGKIAMMLFFTLIAFGLLMLSSAGIAEGQKKFDSSSYYLTHQLLFGLLPGLVLFMICSRIPCRKWRPFALPLLIFAIALLVLIFVPSLGVGVRGAQRWINLKIATIQPSEFLKFALIVYLAAWFGNRERGTYGVLQLVPFFLILSFISFLLILQPDIGTLGIVVMIAIAMYFFSGACLRHFGILMAVIAVALVVLSIAAPYRFDRIKAFLNPQEDTRDTSYHINQALISIGSGGIFGLGYGQSQQKLGYLPEPVGDSIFAVIVEELGFIGGAVLVLLFTLLVFFLLQIAKKQTDTFARLLVLGVAVWIGGQACVNIAAISGLVPLTGIPLPLISFGSSSLVSLMGAMGIVRNIAKH